MSLALHTYAERPELRENEGMRGIHSVWPAFLLHDPVVNQRWDRLYEEWGDFQFFLCDVETDTVLAEGNSVPVNWDGLPQPGGIDWAFVHRFDEGGEPTTLCAVQVMIAADQHGRGFSRLMLEKMTSIAREQGLDALVAPVRPTWKHRYPLTPIDRYIEWRRGDGELLDPWLRTHARMGAEILAVAPQSMTIPGTIAQWEAWTDLVFPDTGEYVVPGALVPVAIDRERDLGLYVEPNVWMRHPL